MHRKHPGREWMACPRQILPALTSGKRGEAQKWGGSSCTRLPQDEAVAPSNLGEGRSLEAGPPGPWDSPTARGVLDRRLCSGSARVWGGGIPSRHPAFPYPTPRGRPPAPPPSAPASQPAPESPAVRPPHPCENPDAAFLVPFSPRFLQRAPVCVPLIILEDLGVRPRMAAP